MEYIKNTFLVLMPNPVSPLHYKIPAPEADYFKDIHTMALTSFFPRSGSSLSGYLLDAHPNMIMVHEPAEKGESLYDKVPFIVLLNYILYIDKMKFEDAKRVRSLQTLEETSHSNDLVKRIYNAKSRYIIVPNQWQGRCESLKVMGVKNSLPLAETLLKKGVVQKLKENLKKARIRRLRFIFTVRNPYDMITTDAVYWGGNKRLRTVTQDDINKILDYKVHVSFPDMCRQAARLFKLMQPTTIPCEDTDILVSKHEDIVASPAKQLAKLCEFLEVPYTEDYLKDCASAVRSKINKSRYELRWSSKQKRKVAKLIDKYHFFSGYDWDT